jgi:hypothetical protein
MVKFFHVQPLYSDHLHSTLGQTLLLATIFAKKISKLRAGQNRVQEMLPIHRRVMKDVRVRAAFRRPPAVVPKKLSTALLARPLLFSSLRGSGCPSEQRDGQETLRYFLLKTTELSVLLLCCGLTAFQSRAGNDPVTHSGLMAEFGGFPSADTPAPSKPPGQETVTNHSVDLTSGYKVSLDDHSSLNLVGPPQVGATALTIGATQNWPAASDHDSARHAGGASSFILIGLGGVVLTRLCWKMTRPPQQDSIKAK